MIENNNDDVHGQNHLHLYNLSSHCKGMITSECVYLTVLPGKHTTIRVVP